jgi:hypothetical protein
MNTRPLASWLLVLAALLQSCAPGGCYDHQKHFSIAPAEPCLQPEPDVCDATGGTLTLRNGCSEALVVAYGTTDAGLAPVTIAPGARGSVNVSPFMGPWVGDTRHVSFPAELGPTAIVISYDVVSS